MMTTSPSSSRKPAWTSEDIGKLLAVIEHRGFARLLDRKVQRNQKTYLRLQLDLETKGVIKDWNQIREKWKTLKKKYGYCQRDADARGRFIFYEKMDRLLAHRRMTPGEKEELPLPNFDTEIKDQSSSIYSEVLPLPEETSSRQEDDTTDDEVDDAEEAEEDQFQEFLGMIRSEGEKDRETTLHAVDLLITAMNQNVNKLIDSRNTISHSRLSPPPPQVKLEENHNDGVSNSSKK